jgi:hypothetical protein
MDGADQEAQAENENGLKKDDHRKNEIRPVGKIPVDQKDREDEEEGDKKVDEAGKNDGKGHDLPWEIDRLDQVTAVGEGRKGNHKTRRKVAPRQVTAHKKHGKIFHPDLHNIIEGQGVDQDDQKRVQKRPQDAEVGPFIPGFKISRYEIFDQVSIPEDMIQKH